jgi:large subunit ribosomal protein L17
MAMLHNMVTSLLRHERIETTIPKAKEARPLAERIITLGKRGGLANVRLASRTVKDREVLEKVFGELKDRYAARPGGYTRIMRKGFRRGDAAEIAILELVDRPAAAAPEKKGKEGKGEEKAEEKKE